MKSKTDTELMQEWNATVKSLGALRGRYDAKSKAKRHALDERQHAIRIEWNDLFERKRSGNLTDPRYIQMVIESAKGLSLSHGLIVTISQSEGPKDNAQIARCWWVFATCQASESKLQDYGTAVVKELSKSRAKPLLSIETDRQFHQVEHDAKRNAGVVAWAANNWIWDGPEESRGLVSLR